jgi:hypothetical protein
MREPGPLLVDMLPAVFLSTTGMTGVSTRSISARGAVGGVTTGGITIGGVPTRGAPTRGIPVGRLPTGAVWRFCGACRGVFPRVGPSPGLSENRQSGPQSGPSWKLGGPAQKRSRDIREALRRHRGAEAPLVGLAAPVSLHPAILCKLGEALPRALIGETRLLLEIAPSEPSPRAGPLAFSRVEPERQPKQAQQATEGRVAEPRHVAKEPVWNRHAEKPRRERLGRLQIRARHIR